MKVDMTLNRGPLYTYFRAQLKKVNTVADLDVVIRAAVEEALVGSNELLRMAILDSDKGHIPYTLHAEIVNGRVQIVHRFEF
ncbi:hypothetical protein HOG48_02295 [Candidatus Peregrinibacteria bacterium]|jgi:hypothetical protein|nr:hypothetical protein [Candidatus Peregrinibacteria bacterium]